MLNHRWHGCPIGGSPEKQTPYHGVGQEAVRRRRVGGRERLFMREAEVRYWKTRRFAHFECGDAMVYRTRRIADMSTVV